MPCRFAIRIAAKDACNPAETPARRPPAGCFRLLALLRSSCAMQQTGAEKSIFPGSHDAFLLLEISEHPATASNEVLEKIPRQTPEITTGWLALTYSPQGGYFEFSLRFSLPQCACGSERRFCRILGKSSNLCQRASKIPHRELPWSAVRLLHAKNHLRDFIYRTLNKKNNFKAE